VKIILKKKAISKIFVLAPVVYMFYHLYRYLYLYERGMDIVQYALIGMVLLGLFLLLYAYELRILFGEKTLVLVILISFLGLLSILLQDLFSGVNNEYYGRSTIVYLRTVWISSMLWLSLGLCASVSNISKSNAVAIVLFLFLFHLISNSISFVGYIDYALLAEMQGIKEYEGYGHLAVADYFFACAVFVFILVDDKYRPFVMLGSLYMLFMLGGRGVLYLGSASLVFCEFLFADRQWNFKSKYILFVIVILLLLYVGNVFMLLSKYFPYQYLTEILFMSGFNNDGSYQERLFQYIEGWQLLDDQFFYGGISFYVQKFGSIGSYMHNFMSAWQFFGFPFFIVYLFMWYIGLTNIMKIISGYTKDPMIRYIVILFVYSALSMIFVKSVNFWMGWYALGLALGVKSRGYNTGYLLDSCNGHLEKV